MSINIKIGQKAQENQVAPETDTKIKLRIRKTLDGNLMITDHADLDLFIVPPNHKIIAIPKEDMNDDVYIAQNRFFDFLIHKGVIKFDSVRGGSIFGAMEAIFGDSKFADPVQAVLLVIDKFMAMEKPLYDALKNREEEYEEFLTNPEEEDSTELGEIPHKDLQGSNTQRVRSWGITNRIFEELQKETGTKTNIIYHYIFAGEEENIKKILESGHLKPVNKLKNKEREEDYADRLNEDDRSDSEEYWENEYNKLYKDVVKLPYKNYGIYMTTLDLFSFPNETVARFVFNLNEIPEPRVVQVGADVELLKSEDQLSDVKEKFKDQKKVEKIWKESDLKFKKLPQVISFADGIKVNEDKLEYRSDNKVTIKEIIKEVLKSRKKI